MFFSPFDLCRRRLKKPGSLNILLSNGRFPLTIDLARQLKLLGHFVYVVDPMEYHICKFSISVVKSYYVPAPHVDEQGYIKAVKDAVKASKIDLIIPLHEEILYLSGCKEPSILNCLFAPDFDVLIRLHNKWEFTKWLEAAGLDHPQSWLCKSRNDVMGLALDREMALKPVFGRARCGVHHYKPAEGVPEDLAVDDENHYIAQEWVHGLNYCSYMVVRNGDIQAFCVYPVTETIDGSSCVYFEAIEHPRIFEYCQTIARALPGQSGQIAFDFIEEQSPKDRLVAIECNPRATSGVHLFSGTTLLAKALTDPRHETPSLAQTGHHRQVAPGMMMWDNRDVNVTRYVEHMKRLTSSRDVVFAFNDILPTLMQPFLLTSYYKICQERNLNLPEMFQWDLTWEPSGQKLRHIRGLLEKDEVKEEIFAAGKSKANGYLKGRRIHGSNDYSRPRRPQVAN